jgi:hypothetical protein
VSTVQSQPTSQICRRMQVDAMDGDIVAAIGSDS